MKNTILALLALSFVFTGCKKEQKYDDKLADLSHTAFEEKEDRESPQKEETRKDKKENPQKPTKSNKKDKQVIEAKKSQDSSQGIFKDLEGMEFLAYITNSSERIYFHKNGSFDGCKFSGDGQYMLGSLFKGRFEGGKKIDDYTYEIKLADLSYQSPTSGMAENTPYELEYSKSNYFDKSIAGDSYYIHLPGTSLKSLDDKGIFYQLDYNPHVKDGIIDMYMISAKPLGFFEHLDHVAFMHEGIGPGYQQANQKADHVFEDFVYKGFNSHEESQIESRRATDKNQANIGFKKSQGINIPKSGFLSHAEEIEMADRIIKNYRQDKEKSTSEAKDHKSGQALIDTGARVLYNLDEAEFFEDHLDNKTLIDLERAKEKPIIKVLGNIIEEKPLRATSEGFDDIIINKYTMEATTRDGEPILIRLSFVGDIDTATVIDENGVETVKSWAIPLGEYRIDHPEYGNIRVLEFAAGEGTQALAHKVYGDSYGF